MSSERSHAVPTLRTAQAMVKFWLAAGPGKWFSKDVRFDAEFRHRFHEAHFAAARQQLVDWLDQPESALALILLLDQYPRNAFRETGHMFATDSLALAYARRSLAHLDQIQAELRNFILLPFMHAENLEVQKEALVLYQQHAPDSMSWAQEHHDIIARFGRFPHRNPALGRNTTAEEQAFLDQGGFSG